MKIRNGFVSNSSSSSFVVYITEWMIKIRGDGHTKETYDKIQKMTDRSGDLSRCTGKISRIGRWLDEHDNDDHYIFQKVLRLLNEEYDDKLIVVRESDEDMGGTLADYGLTKEDLYPYMVYTFEYH